MSYTRPHIWFLILLLFFSGLTLPVSGVSQVQDDYLHFDHLTIQEGLSHNTVHCMIQDRHGFVWIGTQNGLNKYDGYSFEVYLSQMEPRPSNGFIGKSISSLFEDSQGNIWVGTRKNGINVMVASTDRFRNLQADSNFAKLNGFDITQFFEDQSGNIWISSVGGGLLKYDPKVDTSYLYTAKTGGLVNDILFDLVEDEQGTIWLAGAGDALNYLKKGSHQFSQAHVNIEGAPNMSGYRKTLLLDGEYLWIGTEGTGLYRMSIKDQDFIHISQANGEGRLKSNSVRDIFKSSEGQVFLATDGGGLHILDTATLYMKHYSNQVGENTSLSSNALFCFLKDRSNNLWIGSYNGGISILKVHKTWFDVYSPSLPDGKQLGNRSILGIYQSQDGDIWIGTDGGGLSLFDPSINQFTNSTFTNDPNNPGSIRSNVVKTIFEDSRNRLWVGFFGAGVDVYNRSTQSFQSLPAITNHVWSIVETQEGNIWFGTIGGGIHVYNPQTANLHNYVNNPDVPHSLSENNIMQLFIDREQRIWVGTADQGLNVWDDSINGFHQYQFNPDDPNSLSNDEIRAIFQDKDGTLWIGTEGGGLNRYLGQGKFERIGKQDGLIANSVMGITQDLTGHLWISTFDGLSRIDPASRDIRNFGFHKGPHSNQFNQMAILTAKDGTLYIGGINGLNTLDPLQVKDQFDSVSIVFTDLKIFTNSIPSGELADGRTILKKPIEEAEHIYLSYIDNSFSISFSAMEYTNPSEHVFAYKMEGFDEQWQYTDPGQHSITYTNLDPGKFVFHIRHKQKHARISINVSPPFWETTWFTLLVGAILASLIIFGVRFVVKRREAAHRRQLLEAEREILQLTNDKLETEVNAKNSKLMFSAVQMAHKNEILNNVKTEIKDIQGNETDSGKKLRHLVRKLEKELKSEDYWKEFNLYFNQVDSNFGQELLKKHPELTPNDLRICSLIRINLTTKEIASLLNISVRGVEQSRYRLRKRLGLGSNDNLVKYISSFS